MIDGQTNQINWTKDSLMIGLLRSGRLWKVLAQFLELKRSTLILEIKMINIYIFVVLCSLKIA